MTTQSQCIHLLACGHLPYGIDGSGKQYCYNCCAENEKAAMLRDGKATMYLNQPDNAQWEVTNWPGTLRLPVRYHTTGRHNIAGVRYDVWLDFAGRNWHGIQYGDNTQLVHLRQIKDS